jgi:PAS domain S-box-containing protein
MASTPLERPPVEESNPVSAAVRAHDWGSTPLGPIAGWPLSLRFALGVCEHCSLATAIYWGPDLRLIYNDAWHALMPDGEAGLGLRAAETPFSLWPIVADTVEEVLATGTGAFVREQPLVLSRGGVSQETFWNCSTLPLYDEEGRIAGILNQANEVTRAVLAERRLSFQIELADRLRGLRGSSAIKSAAIEMLGQYVRAARVGYAELDADEQQVTVRRDWTRDASTANLAGMSAPIGSFGEGAAEFLRAGEPLAIGDMGEIPQVSAQHAEGWAAIGTRAMIVVPLVREGALKALLYVHDPEPRVWKRSEVAMARDVAERTWDALERAQAEQSLRDSEDHYRHAVELNPQVSWTSLPDGQLNRVSRRWRDWTGGAGTGDSWAEGLHPNDRQRTFDAWRHCVATGEPYDIEHRVQYRDGRYRWARSRAFPRYNDKGEICLWYGTTEDIDERRRAEEHQRLLINELNHRVKNTLATVQAIAFQTLKGDIPLEEARRRFEARLMALSRAHNLLTEQNWGGAPLDRVVRDSTGHLPHDRFEVEGEPFWLGPRAALALALAFHELSTNAVKYGALSGEHGKVRISWAVEGQILRLQWKERDGPAVAEPAARGFGTRLIERGLASDLGGSARMRFESDGLLCLIEASVAAVQARENELG